MTHGRISYGWLFSVPLISALMGCIPQGHVDILVPLKELNQDIAPVVLSCPDWHYPVGQVVDCKLESSLGEARVQVEVLADGIDFADPVQASLTMRELS